MIKLYSEVNQLREDLISMGQMEGAIQIISERWELRNFSHQVQRMTRAVRMELAKRELKLYEQVESPPEAGE